MKQYLDLLNEIKKSGTYKPAAREGMPGTQSLFGYQFRHNLGDGFPLLTTKKMFWKGVVGELLWFLRGDTNIKYLIDNGINIWNEDAYNYYVKIASANSGADANGIYWDNNDGTLRMFQFDEFIQKIKGLDKQNLPKWNQYTLGDCGYQYGRVWRKWEVTDYFNFKEYPEEHRLNSYESKIRIVDQIQNLVNQLKKYPESRRHIVTAIDPGHETDLALYWCHAMFQFNCRPLTLEERHKISMDLIGHDGIQDRDNNSWHQTYDKTGIPKYYLDCQLYQRSADVFLGVPFNIASYALLTHILAEICNMIPGEFIHTFGDVHIYDNHKEAVEEQLSRTPGKLPRLKLSCAFDWEKYDLNKIWDWDIQLFELKEYNPQSPIKGELSTGLKK